MTITKEYLVSLWEPLSADDDRLQNLIKYVPLEFIDPASYDRELLCRDCEEVVFFYAGSEIWNTKDSNGLMERRNGLMVLPKDISVTVYKGYFSVN
ncbi:uncharacterized protein N7446_003931 [Penicillium canescens]|uniref:uncharacterized protein n=1 Tax=Penicillium canescens TaxID=5083 RepID=UPI0026E0A334|nr:uncharacterized protein N7446_003931 [Penicillium canescens]KAJ6066894.1 hypothetical protein N7446_003931 [Penicillium canescens]